VKNKKNILILVDWYYPGHKAGGPIKSVFNIATQLQSNFNFSVLTTDTDFNSYTPYEDITTNQWTDYDGIRILYIKKKQGLFSIVRIIKTALLNKQVDIIYLNSLFSFYFTIVPLLLQKVLNIKTKIILAPRGMLGAGALFLKSGKKKLFIRLAKLFGLYSGITWHASTGNEKLEIITHFGENALVKTALNLPARPPLVKVSINKKKNDLHLVFLSRLTPKKNLDYTLELLNNIPGNGKIIFDIFGPIEDEKYWERCQQQIAAMPENIQVSYKGSVPEVKIHATLSQYHFFIMPTMHENFGHAIFDAISAGRPVIISNNTPWRELQKLGIGWNIPLDAKTKFIDVIEYCLEMNQETFDTMSNKAYNYAKHFAAKQDILNQNKQLFGH